jgi:predicted HTH transcriptional regulator
VACFLLFFCFLSPYRFPDLYVILGSEFKGPPDAAGEPWSFARFKQSFRENAGKAACGFLNSGQGGRVLFGIHDARGTVVGVRLDQKERDEVKLLWTSVRSHYYPALMLHQTPLRLREVETEDEQDDQRVVVVEISVKPTPAGMPPRVYFWKGDAYMRHESSTLKMKPEQLVHAIREQLVYQLEHGSG